MRNKKQDLAARTRSKMGFIHNGRFWIPALLHPLKLRRHAIAGMARKNTLFYTIIFFIVITLFFFYQFFIFFKIPFPGDLLISTYAPWKYSSFLGYVPGSFPTKEQYFDVIRQIYPWKTLVLQQIKSGIFPLWNPYNFAGSPLFANSQSAVLYPFNIFYVIFSQPIAWAITVFLQPLLALCFTYLYCRKIGISKIGAIFSSISYSFSLYMTVFLEYNTFGQAIVWLPLILFGIEFLREKKIVFGTLCLTIGIVCCSFAGHLQIFGFIVGFSFLYLLWRLWKTSVYRFIFSLITFFLSIGICSIQLFPTFELIQQAARVAQSYPLLIKTLLLQPYQFILFFSPDIFGNPATHNYLISDTYPGNAVYIGLIPLLFAIGSLLLIKKNSFVRFYSILSFLFLLLFFRNPLSEILYRFNIPLISSGSPTNAIFLLSFSLAVLAGIGIDIYLKHTKKINWFISSGIIVFLLSTGFVFLFDRQLVSTKNLAYSFIIFLSFLVVFLAGYITKKKQFASIIFLIITVLDLFYFFQKFNSFVPKSLVFPPAPVFSYLQSQHTIQRFWGYGAAGVEANFSTQFQLYNPDGYDPLYPKNYGAFIQSSQDGKIHTTFTDETRSDAKIFQGGPNDFATNQYRLKVLNLLGVSYVLDRLENGSTENTFPSNQFNLVYNNDGWKIFKNKTALPHIFLAGNYKTYSTDSEFSTLFFNNSLDPFRIVLLKSPIALHIQSDPQSSVEIAKYSPEEIITYTSSKTPQLLFISDTYYPGWQATIDGSPSQILQADYAFRSVAVPAGNHTVIMTYKPQSFLYGIYATIISVVLLCVVTVFFKRKNGNV